MKYAGFKLTGNYELRIWVFNTTSSQGFTYLCWMVVVVVIVCLYRVEAMAEVA